MIYRVLFKLLLRRIPPERTHRLAVAVVAAATSTRPVRAALRRVLGVRDRGLAVHALGMTFPNPVGAAGGLDKDVVWYEGLGALGFGFVEVGTITARPQGGNPEPRVFRLLGERALVNSMGFPNPGAEVAARRLARRSGETIVGANIGKSAGVSLDRAGDDYRAATKLVAPHADFIVLNVSSPNTPGIRDLQALDPLRTLIADVRDELRESGIHRPILVKISPDLSDDRIAAIADLALELELDGIVAVNTTMARTGVGSDPDTAARPGGLSGPPLKARALAVLRQLYAHAGDRLVLVSVGGIETADDAWERILAGATLVQAHTGFIYGGPTWARKINAGILRHLRARGYASVADAVGRGAGLAAPPSARDCERVEVGLQGAPVTFEAARRPWASPARNHSG